MRPQTQYADQGQYEIAYQVSGAGPIDLVYIPGWISNVEYEWENPLYARFFAMMGSFSRLIRFDKRGSGLSDRDAGFPSLEDRMEDLRLVLDTVGSDRAVIFGMSEAGFLATLFAATYPERTEALVLMGAFARSVCSDDYPHKRSLAELEQWVETLKADWGGPIDLGGSAPDVADEAWAADWFGSLLRLSASKRTACELALNPAHIDVRDILPTIKVPTLVFQRTGDQWAPVGNGRYLAEHIPGAEYREHEDNNHMIWAGDTERIVRETRSFLLGLDVEVPVERVLLTVMMTDICDSTARLHTLGDAAWAAVLSEHHATVRAALRRHGGHEIDTAGDGFLTTFDGPSQALACARDIHIQMNLLTLTLRIAVHTGECEKHPDGLRGMAVHTAARILGETAPGTTTTSSTVRDLVVGSPFTFDALGVRTLKGLNRDWQLYCVNTAGTT
ncbi:MAG: adenylate/guanylate cyclase domain-containing protein [Pseudomonadota bacterium]